MESLSRSLGVFVVNPIDQQDSFAGQPPAQRRRINEAGDSAVEFDLQDCMFIWWSRLYARFQYPQSAWMVFIAFSMIYAWYVLYIYGVPIRVPI